MIYREKMQQAMAIVAEENVDLWLTIGKETVMNSEPVLSLLSSVEFGGLTCLMVSKDTNVVLAGHLDSFGMGQTGIFNEVVTYDKSFKEDFLLLMKRFNPMVIALNYSGDVAADGLTHGLYLYLQDLFKEYGYQGSIISSEKIIGKLRGRKTSSEIDCIKRAVKATETILLEVKDYLKAGLTQIDVWEFCQKRISDYGYDNAWEKQHNPGVMVKGAPMGHAGPGDYKIPAGSLVTLDFGVKVDNYCSDVQRVYYVPLVGEVSVPLEHQLALSNIQKAQDAGVELMRPGTPAYVPDQKARELIKEFGYPDFNFGFGHQVGLQTHDGGVMMGPLWERYLGRVESELETNMVLTVDINIGFEAGQMGQEDMAVIYKDKTEYLTSRQTEVYFCKGD